MQNNNGALLDNLNAHDVNPNGLSLEQLEYLHNAGIVLRGVLVERTKFITHRGVAGLCDSLDVER